MTGGSSPAAEQFFAALEELRQATVTVSYATLVRLADGQGLSSQITSQRLSDWFSGKAVPADPDVVRFLVEQLQPRADPASAFRKRPLSWWLNVHRDAVRQRLAHRDAGGRHTAETPRPRLRLGRPIGACDPTGPGGLGVHPAIRIPGAALGVLPTYVQRNHDQRMRETARAMLTDGRSRLMTLVGGSSTGKTRSCWELVHYLDGQDPGRWRLWHPYDPTRPNALVTGLDQVSPYTIVWLNEAQLYLQLADTKLGERIAAGLRTLLHDEQRGPVLVLATLWREYWDALTTRPAADVPDSYAQARDLLKASMVALADCFTPAELGALRSARADPRVGQAALRAEGGRITQYLAGAPEVEDRYRTAPPATRAIIDVAIDARRLGYPASLPIDLLRSAAPGYLGDHDWDHLDDDWMTDALSYAARPCNGARGPLTRIRPRPGQESPGDGRPHYQLADSLEQIGRTERAGIYPPQELWRAFAAATTDAVLLNDLGRQAHARGRYQHAVWLYEAATHCGHNGAWRTLVRLRENSGDHAGAEAMAVQAADRGDTRVLWALIRLREETGYETGLESLYQQAVDHGHIGALHQVAHLRERAGDQAGAQAARRKLSEQLGGGPRIHHGPVDLEGDFDDDEDADFLPQQAPDIAHIADELVRKGYTLKYEGDLLAAEALYAQAVDYGTPYTVQSLAFLWDETGDEVGARRALAFGLTGAGRPATRLSFDMGKSDR